MYSINVNHLFKRYTYKYCCIIYLVRGIWTKSHPRGQACPQCHLADQLSLVYATSQESTEPNAASLLNFT